MTSNFHPTHWTLVLRSHGEGDEAQTALTELCEIYYEPIVSFLRRDGRNEQVAREVAHEFFHDLLEKGLGQPDRTRGRFRSYLLGALKHSLIRKRDAANAQKRGAGAEHLSITKADSTGGLSSHHEIDSLQFDRDWAHALIARALQDLEVENASKPGLFQVLRPWLDGNATTTQQVAARELGISETAVKVAIHRMRVRFRELIRKEVAETVSQPSEVAEELRHLMAVVSASPTQ